MRWTKYELEFNGKAMGLRERIRTAWGVLLGRERYTFTLHYRIEPTVYFDDVTVTSTSRPGKEDQ